MPGSSPGARLFRFVGSQANHYEAADGREVECGCLTMIRSDDGYGAFVRGEYDAALTERIRFDERIPQSGAAIRLDDLPVFAEWQRRLDKELGRT